MATARASLSAPTVRSTALRRRSREVRLPARAMGARGVHALVRLVGAECDGQWQAVAVSDEVQLGREPTAAAPQRVVGGLAGSRVFPRARSDPMRPDLAAVDAPQLPVDPARLGQLALERGEDTAPQPLARPPALARSDL